MRKDEKWLLMLCQRAYEHNKIVDEYASDYASKNVKQDGTRLYVFGTHEFYFVSKYDLSVRQIIRCLAFPIHINRVEYILKKWCSKGIYDFGTNLFRGWITEKGMEINTADNYDEFPEIIFPNLNEIEEDKLNGYKNVDEYISKYKKDREDFHRSIGIKDGDIENLISEVIQNHMNDISTKKIVSELIQSDNVL